MSDEKSATQDRVRRVFDRVDRKTQEAINTPGAARAKLVAQIEETYRAEGEAVDHATVDQAVDEVLAEEAAAAAAAASATPSLWSYVPRWAYPIVAVVGLVLAVPLARVLFRVVELLLRAVI
jgi:hypothetical protein